MTPSGSTQVSARTAGDHLRRPALGSQPTPVSPSGARTTTTGPTDAVGGAVDLLARLDGIRARLGTLAPLVHDEAARRLAAAVREVDALREDLVRPVSGHPSTVPATVPPAGPTPALPVAQAPPASAPALPTTRHRPPALPCGPDYPLLQGHRGA